MGPIAEGATSSLDVGDKHKGLWFTALLSGMTQRVSKSFRLSWAERRRKEWSFWRRSAARRFLYMLAYVLWHVKDLGTQIVLQRVSHASCVEFLYCVSENPAGSKAGNSFVALHHLEVL